MKNEPVPQELWQRHEQEWLALRPEADGGQERNSRLIWQRPLLVRDKLPERQ